jgi:hypothetical protein
VSKIENIKGTLMLIVIQLLMVVIGLNTSYSETSISDTECREYDEVYYENPDEYVLSRINVEEMGSDSILPVLLSAATKEFSPQGTKHYIIQPADFTKQGPWNTDIYVLGNRANPLKIKITFRDHGNGGVRARWLNEKLLFVQVWWGRIVSTDLILDLDTAKWLYLQNANYGNIIKPCVEKVVQPEKSKSAKELRDIILNQEWRLFSLIFSVMPPDGFPIDFRSSGEVVTENLRLVKTWTIYKDRTLDFFDSSGNKIYIFDYDEKEDLFIHTINTGGMKGNIIVIVPSNKSFNLISYSQTRQNDIKNR